MHKNLKEALFSKYKFILCSGSPRRREILRRLGLNFVVRKSGVAEIWQPNLSIKENLIRLSIQKCESNLEEGKISIGADTIVCFNGEILGKPEDYEDAFNKLKKLSGRKHYVYTGLALGTIIKGEKILVSGVQKSKVIFKKMSVEDIRQYLKIIDYQDKAGAYAAQEHGELIIKKIKGERENVIGFPMKLFLKLLLKMHKIIMKRSVFDDKDSK